MEEGKSERSCILIGAGLANARYLPIAHFGEHCIRRHVQTLREQFRVEHESIAVKCDRLHFCHRYIRSCRFNNKYSRYIFSMDGSWNQSHGVERRLRFFGICRIEGGALLNIDGNEEAGT